MARAAVLGAAVALIVGAGSGCAGSAKPASHESRDRREPLHLTGGAIGSGQPLHTIYRRSPSFESAIDGSFATGIEFADINRDGKPDLVVANGNDMSPQPLMVYLNHCSPTQTTCFNAYPEWYSTDFDYLGNLAVGDLDHDGWLDVAVSVPLDKKRLSSGGGVKIYMGGEGGLEGLPSQRIGEGYGSFDCVLGDVNADGLLDLAVAAFNMPTAAPQVRRAVLRGHTTSQFEPARIYLNERGRLHTVSDWKSDNRMYAFSALAADIDQDGWMDLAFGAHSAFLYRGRVPSADAARTAGEAGGPVRVPVAAAPAWESEPTSGLAFGIDAGRIGVDVPLALAVSRACVPGGPPCTSDFALFRPDQGQKQPVWRSDAAHLGSMLLLADLNADGLLDLVGGQWGDEVTGAPLWFFQGSTEGSFSRAPDFRTAGTGIAVAESLAVADTRSRATSQREYVWTPKRRGAIITLPDRRVSSVIAVTIGGRRVLPTEWAFAVGQNWISVARGYGPDVEVRVTYQASSVQDLIEATWSPQRGNLLYDSFLSGAVADAGARPP